MSKYGITVLILNLHKLVLSEHVSYASSSLLQVDISDILPSGADNFSQLSRESKVIISNMDVQVLNSFPYVSF